jgi:hypothetical protein
VGRAAAWFDGRPIVVWTVAAVALVAVLSAAALTPTYEVVDGHRYFFLDDDLMISMR